MSKRKKKFRVKMRGRNKDFEIVTNIEGDKQGPVCGKSRHTTWGLGEKVHHKGYKGWGWVKAHHTGMGWGGEDIPHGEWAW